MSAAGLADFAVAPHLIDTHGLVVMDWQAVNDWLDGLSDNAQRNGAWSACERAWVRSRVVSVAGSHPRT